MTSAEKIWLLAKNVEAYARFSLDSIWERLKSMLVIKESPYFPYSRYPNEMSAEMSIFQTAEMQRCFFTNSLMYAVPKQMQPRTLSLLNDNVPVLIFPLLVRGTKAELAGHANGMCELSPIYFKNSEEKLKLYLKFLFDASRYDEYLLSRIRDSSHFCRILDEGIAGYDISATSKDNVQIDFSQGYAAWFQALGKSVRQNLRTAYNRLEKDGKSLRVEVSNGQKLSHSFMNKLLDIYIKRHDERYNVKTSVLKSIYLRYFDFSTRALLKIQSLFMCAYTYQAK